MTMMVPGFNPRSHIGSDPDPADFEVSEEVFQSTLPYRERLKYAIHLKLKRLFQSTLPYRERRYSSIFQKIRTRFQSTLPYRERHSRRFNFCKKCFCFNPRSHIGSDPYGFPYFLPDLKFQSTLPYRERPCGLPTIYASALSFNPRSHIGSDVYLFIILHHLWVSIHAPI